VWWRNKGVTGKLSYAIGLARACCDAAPVTAVTDFAFLATGGGGS
jgi:hypothetical protein